MALSPDRKSHRLAFPSVLLVLSLLWLPSLVNAQTYGLEDPVTDFCSRWWSQSVVKNDILYIDSGAEKFNVSPSGDVYFGTNNYMLTISLTDTWDWKKKKNESQYLAINEQLKNESNPATGTIPPSLMRGTLFQGPTNTSAVYRFGGTTYMYNQSYEGYVAPDSSSYPLWSYKHDASGFPWNQYSLGQPWRPNHGAAAEATDQGLAFYLNGQIDKGTSAKTQGRYDNEQTLYSPVGGMLVINLVDMTAANISTPTIKGNAPRVGGTMEYVGPVGENGILVAFGGQIQPDLKQGEIANMSKGELIDFNSVDIFDIGAYLKDPSSNGTWYQQTTTGDIPPPRIDFCTVSISAPDNSSHHIYLYGGRNPTTNSSYDDVVVLTMPSFTWTNVWPQGESPRWGHNCHVAGKRQMITVGGNITNINGCDWERKGVAVWEMSTLDWGSVYRSNTSHFQVPRSILAATGGTMEGQATIGDPPKGWTSEELRSVFWTSRWTVPTTWVNTAPEKKKTNVGAIAGGAAGGVAALLLIAGGLFFWYRQRKKARAPHELSNNEVERGSTTSDKKKRYELQGLNENDPAELPGPDPVELNAPRELVEADHNASPNAAELPGTNVIAGGVHGVPIVRTPGDDLPEPPLYTPGLRRPASQSRSRSRSRTSSQRAAEATPAARDEDFKTPPEGMTTGAGQETTVDYFATPLEEAPKPLSRAPHGDAEKDALKDSDIGVAR